MNNKEKILKYLSDEFSEEEKLIFENEIQKDELLNTEFQKFKNNLNEIKQLGKTEIDEIYFANLIPKVRTKMQKEENRFAKMIPRLAFVIPLIALMIIFSDKIFQTNNSEKILGESIDENSVEQYLNSEEENTELISDENSEEIIDNELSKTIFKNDETNLNEVNIQLDENEIITSLNDEEITFVINELQHRKIL